MIDPGLVGTLLRQELRMLLRSRRTVVFSIVLPMLFLPLMLFSGQWLEERRQRRLEETTHVYAVAGSRAELARELLAAALAAPGDEPLRIAEETAADPEAALRGELIDFFVEALSVEEAALVAAEEAAERAAKEDEPASEEAGEEERSGVASRQRESAAAAAARRGVPLLRVSFLGDRDRSSEGARKLRELLSRAREERRDGVLAASGFPVAMAEVQAVEEEDLATDAQVTGSGLGRFVTAMLMLFIFTGAAVVATDSIAGEKERGTLETLLTTAAERLEIVGAKLLAIVIVALVITSIQVANLVIYVGLGVIPVSEGFALEVSPLAAVVLFALFLPLVLLVSSVLLMLSGFARTYQEAQLLFFPVIMVGALPALAAVMPGVTLRSAIVLVPVANISVAVREVLVGTFDWVFLALAWLVTAAVAGWSLRATTRALSVERLIAGGAAESGVPATGPRLFEQRVLLWFGVVWVVLFVAAANLEVLSTLPRQIVFNVVILFGGASWLMIRRYGLDPRRALALRAPRPAVWLGVAIGVPAAQLTGIAVFLLASRLLPVPQRMLEEFGRAIMPAEMPFWQLLLLAALLPGIFEEIAFRGVLLYGLRRRLHPAVLCLAVGLVFGLYHVTLFRIAPTMYLGVVLTAVTLLTGSIFPAMAWHALNNALSIAAARVEVPLAGLEASTYLLAAVLLAVAFWVIWRNRTPYPELRPWRRSWGR